MAIWACSDLHGRYDLFQMIKDFINPKDIVYVLGDCGDRGPNGWDIIKEVYENPQFIYLMGNHEKMLANAMVGDTSLCFYNGGKKTYQKWRYKDGAPMYWRKRLLELSLEKVYINKRGQKIIMCHAGYTPYLGAWSPWVDDYIWNRDHFNDEWDENYPDTFIIHGHTPIPYMDDYLYSVGCDVELDGKISPGVLWYCEDKKGIKHKCNIDCGAVFTGHTALLNLDTFEQHIFMAEDCVYED